ncbi:MAG: prolyl aminopeptidase [Cellvibrionaceae bacterium]|nr:prolyl aminopeptidase [Cellvibrionaceae bacterium]
MLTLYPSIRPYNDFYLPVSDGHQLYVEECGNPEGIPVLFVHGGPGGGCGKKDRSFFDPEMYRIILFDQRGAGRSLPHAALENNTTDHLLADMEQLREHLGVDQWVLFGGSWGSTLSLLYAQANPERVMGLILRGIFLCRQRDFDWFYQAGAHHVFPDYWKDYQEIIPAAERGNMIEAYHKRLTGSDELAKMNAAKHWSLWEGRCSTLRPCPDKEEFFSDPRVAIAIARIEAHYFINDCFIEPDQIVNNAQCLEGIPTTIVHGRYDMVCPLDNAVTLYEALPDSELHIIRDAGHASSEPSITDALVRATEEMAERFKGDFHKGA